MDSDMDKVAILNSGKAPFHEPGLDEMLARHTASGRLKLTASCAEAAAFANLHFIGVGTPQQPNEHAYDLSHLFSAVRQFAPRLKGQAVVAVKSTVPVGTAPRVRDLLHEFAPAGDTVEVAWNPEFLRDAGQAPGASPGAWPCGLLARGARGHSGQCASVGLAAAPRRVLRARRRRLGLRHACASPC
jgi:UDP-glucose 6-dehydrogenase